MDLAKINLNLLATLDVHAAELRESGSLARDLAASADDNAIISTVPAHTVAPFVIGESDLVVVGSGLVAHALAPKLGLVTLGLPRVVAPIRVSMAWGRSREHTGWLTFVRERIAEIALSVA